MSIKYVTLELSLDPSPPLPRNAQKIDVTFFLEIQDPYVPYQIACQMSKSGIDEQGSDGFFWKLGQNFLLRKHWVFLMILPKKFSPAAGYMFFTHVGSCMALSAR